MNPKRWKQEPLEVAILVACGAWLGLLECAYRRWLRPHVRARLGA